MTIVVCEWEEPTVIPYAALDVIVPGGFFSIPRPDPNILFYEFDYYGKIF